VVFLIDLSKRSGSFQTQHNRGHDHQRAYKIIITTAATFD